jgi:SPW repeat
MRERGELAHRRPHVARNGTAAPEAVAPLEAVAPVEPVRKGDRDGIVGLAGLNILAGIWLIIAPWVLNYSSADPRWNDVVFGAIVVLFAFGRIAGGIRDAWLSALNAIIGVWIFVAALVIDNTSQAQVNDIVLGALVFVFAALNVAATPRPAEPAPRSEEPASL